MRCVVRGKRIYIFPLSQNTLLGTALRREKNLTTQLPRTTLGTGLAKQIAKNLSLCALSAAENIINCFLSPYALGTRTALLLPGQGCKGTH